MLDLLIKGAVVLTPQGEERLDIGVQDGQIVQLAAGLEVEATEVLEATGLHALPGVIDVHVHFNEPGRTDWEGLESGSAALAAGGGTLFGDMPLNSHPPLLIRKDFEKKRLAAEVKSKTDFALWGGLTPDNVERLPELADAGAMGFKAFMSNSGIPEFAKADDYTLYEGMRTAAKLGRVVAVHAESDGLTAGLAAHLQAKGQTSIQDYLQSRPVLAELEAIQRALLFAKETACKLHIVHISSGSGVAMALAAKAQGVDVSLETCPHYLAFTDADLEQMGAVLKCAPPLRNAIERDHLMQAFLEGQLDIVASDHSPAPPTLKQDPNFFALWGGIGGVQSTLAVLLREGWELRRLPLLAIARLLSQNPAQRFGLAQKGCIALGYDADIVLLDLGQSYTLTEANLYTRHKLSPYLGQSFKGVVQRTLVRGRWVYAQGQFNPEARGRLVRPS